MGNMVKSGAIFATTSGSGQYVLAIDVGGTNMVGAVLDLTGKLVYQGHTFSQGNELAEVRLVRLIEELLRGSGFNKEQFVGIGLGVPGVTDTTGQWVTLAPGLGWHEFNLGKLLEDTFCLPVWADNDVNAFLKGEHLMGSMVNVQNGIAITIGTGIGAGLLLNGEIYRGSRGAAGEMGYWVLDPSTRIQDQRGYGQFESFAAAPGITKRAQALIEKNTHQSPLLDLADGDLTKITAEKVFLAAHLGDEQAEQVVNDTVAVLGTTLANLSSVLDVEKIVIGGGVAEAGERLIGPIQERVNQLSPYPPTITKSSLGSLAIIIGAAAGLLERQ